VVAAGEDQQPEHRRDDAADHDVAAPCHAGGHRPEHRLVAEVAAQTLFVVPGQQLGAAAAPFLAVGALPPTVLFVGIAQIGQTGGFSVGGRRRGFGNLRDGLLLVVALGQRGLQAGDQGLARRHFRLFIAFGSGSIGAGLADLANFANFAQDGDPALEITRAVQAQAALAVVGDAHPDHDPRKAHPHDGRAPARTGHQRRQQHHRHQGEQEQ
jgi:hypothetical protein